MITIIYGPMRSGKTFHKQAFARHFGCSHIVDDWDPRLHEVPDDGRLVLTNSGWRQVADAIACDLPRVAVQVINIESARAVIGVESHPPMQVASQGTVQ